VSDRLVGSIPIAGSTKRSLSHRRNVRVGTLTVAGARTPPRTMRLRLGGSAGGDGGPPGAAAPSSTEAAIATVTRLRQYGTVVARGGANWLRSAMASGNQGAISQPIRVPKRRI
jgi:hypothetical protein